MNKKLFFSLAVIVTTLFVSCSDDDNDGLLHGEVTVEHSSRGSFSTSAAIAVIGGDTRANAYELITYGYNGAAISIYAPYFSFDLSKKAGTVTGAKLRIYAGSYNSTAESEIVQFNEVTTSAEALATTPADNTTLDAINADLANGVVYGSFEISAANNNQYVEVELNEDAVNAINTKIGSGTWSLGGSLATASKVSNTIDEVFNFNNAPTPPATQLVLTFK